jgi:hypothetical protein
LGGNSGRGIRVLILYYEFSQKLIQLRNKKFKGEENG